ncbi:MAG: type II secretion system protein [Kiritimatiellae bacterium]|nr:type II secretion system protein [Kiritimatiellia bacterium]
MKKQSKGFTLVELLVVIGILGILMGVLFPAISGAMARTKQTACKMNGKKLFDAITSAGLQHPDQDECALWPRTSDNKGGDDTDIVGKTYGTSTEYFKDLFDLENYGTQKWNSYLKGLANVDVLYGCGVPAFQGKKIEPRNVMWCVAQGVTSDIDEVVPVLVTRNGNIESLFTTGTFAGTENTEVGIGKDNGGESNTPFGADSFIVVRKGGGVDVVESRYSKLYQIYKNKSFTIDTSSQFKYLKTGAN